MIEKKVALLWDIDGTLLSTNGIGREPLLAAIKKVTTISGDYEVHALSGFTDHQIVNYILDRNGFNDSDRQKITSQILDLYIDLYHQILPPPKFDLLNRIDEVLFALSSNHNILNWICTGNFLKGAKFKLSNVGLESYFASDNYFCSERIEERHKIVRRGKMRANDLGAKAIVIGDTIHDVQASQVNQIKCIAVESLSYPSEVLNSANPDSILKLGWQVDDLIEAIYA